MDRKANYFFALSLITVFVLQGNAQDHAQIIAGGILAIIFCAIAFILRWLTLDGAIAATISGTIVFGLGGYPATIILLLFFLSSTLISKKYILSVEETTHTYSEQIRRDGLQVWSNGFWFTLFLMLAFGLRQELFTLAALGAIATATADTWATELGSKRFEVQTYLLNGLKKVEPGTDGGVSIPGTAAALAGSLMISISAIYVFSLNINFIFPILLAGFLGCLADSYFGATFQREGYSIQLPVLGNGSNIAFDNNMVNWLSSGIGSLLAIIFKLILI